MRVARHTSSSPRTLLRPCLWVVAVTIVLLAGIFGICWFTVDRSGRKRWEKVQSELREAGEPTSVIELHAGLPAHPIDVENYGAISILQNIATPAGKPNRERLEGIFFDSFRHTPVYRAASPGLPDIDLDAWAEGLWQDFEKFRNLKWPALPTRQMLSAENPDTSSAVDRIGTYLQNWSSTIDELYEGIDREVAFFEPHFSAQTDFPASRSMEHLDGIANVSAALYLRSLIAAHSGSPEKLLLNLQTLSRLAEACANERELFAHYVGAAILLRLEDGIVEGFQTRLLQDDPESLRLCVDMLKRVDLRATLEPALRDYILDTTERFGEMATLEGRLLHIPEGTEFTVPSWYPIGWYQNQQAVYAGLANEHIFQALRQQACFGDLIEASKRFNTALNASRTRRHTLITFFKAMDGIHYVHYLPAHAEAYRRMAITACAIELYRLEHDGRSPQDLATLVPDYLDEVPADPMDGAPLRYLREGEQGYRLWSIGIDRRDEKGHLNLTINRGDHVDLGFYKYTGDWPWPAIP